MKQSLLCLLFSLLTFVSYAQPCSIDFGITEPGISPNSTPGIPCIVQGEPYDFTVQFKNFDTFSFGGTAVTVDFIRLDTISGLPCGINWVANKDWDFASGFGPVYANQENGCIRMSGTTNDPVGQYNLRFVVEPDLVANSIPSFTLGYFNAAAYGMQLAVRVVAAASDPCLAIDTLGSYETASCNTKNITAIRPNATSFVNDFRIAPNPVQNFMLLRFNSQIGGDFTIRIWSVLGNSMYETTHPLYVGDNQISLSDLDLVSGTYLLEIGNEQSTSYQRFVVSQ